MGALTLAVLVTLLGACACGLAAWRLAQILAEGRRERIARWAVAVVGGSGGGLIASQLYDLVHQLQINAGYHFSGGHPSLDEVTLVNAFRGILFDGFLLIGLATAVALVALRARRQASA